MGRKVLKGLHLIATPSTRPARRTRFVDAVKLAVKLGMKAGLMAPPSLEREVLFARAIAKAGSDNFGDRWFEQPLAALKNAIESEARLHEAGQMLAAMQFEKVLVDRLWAQQYFAAHPEILARPLPYPVFIVGPMRSGTTRLHRLLSADHRFSHMRSFETLCPVPYPGFTPGSDDVRPRLAKRVRRIALLANPNTLTIHPTGPFEPEEELGLLVNSMWGMKHEAQWFIPSYGRWCERQDATPAYRQMARLLKLIGWSQQVSSLRPFVLKTPQHMLDLPALLQVFPDARFIFTHRDPQAVVGSSASLAWNQTCIHSDHADPVQIGEEWLRKTRVQIERMQAARDQIAPSRMIDIAYDDVERDWRGAMARIYQFLDLEVAPAMPAMETYSHKAKRLKRHPHHYALAQYGLSPGRVMEELGDYVQRYDIAAEWAEAERG